MHENSTGFQFQNGLTKLQFLKNQKGYGFCLESEQLGKPVSLPLNPFVRGKSFNFYPQELISKTDCKVLFQGEGEAKDLEGKTFRYPYQIEVTSGEDSWVRVEVSTQLPSPLGLDFSDGYEPEMTVDLGTLPPYERGDHVWFVTNINNPTKWNDEEYANDMPACYSFDPYLNLEIQLFYDMTEMSWMGYENLARFFSYRVGYRRTYPDFRGRAEVGLHAANYSGKVIQSGNVKFVYYLKTRIRRESEEPVESHEAVATLTNSCLSLLPSRSTWPTAFESWKETALGCAREMNTDGISWRKKADGSEYILNYIDGYSPAWKESMEFRGHKFNMDIPCIDTAAWTGIGLAPLVALKPEEDVIYSDLLKRLEKFTLHLLTSGEFSEVQLVTAAPLEQDQQKSPVKYGCWQYVYILYSLWRFSKERGHEALRVIIEKEVDESLIPCAHALQYLFPLFWDKSTFRQKRSGDNVGICGIYSTFMLDRYEFDSNPLWLEEARKSMIAFYQLPISTIHQEVFLIATGIHAACRLFRITGEVLFKDAYHYLLGQTLRHLYWFRDKNIPEWEHSNIQGTFQGCTPINYAAFFENMEVVSRIAPTLKTFLPSEGLLRVFNLNRINNLYYFPKYLPEKFHHTASMYVPCEDMPQFGGPQEFVGQELYGAGWVFRAYLMWEAFAKAENREVMVLNLDAYEEMKDQRAFSFIVYNPCDELVKTQILFPLLENKKGAIYYQDVALSTDQEIGAEGVSIVLKPREFQKFWLYR